MARADDAADGHAGPAGETPHERPTTHGDATAVRDRALAAATSAYAATYGHPLEHPTTSGPVRWGTSARTALLVAGALSLVGAGVVVHTLLGGPATVVLAEPVVPAPPTSRDGAVPAPGADAGGEQSTGSSAGGGSVEGGPAAGVPPAEAPAGEGAAVVLVHVVGRVHAPGVVELPAGARVVDAVAAAGGATSEADLSGLNLARAVVDGEQVVVPRPGEVVVPDAASAPAAAGSGAAGGRVDLNRATVADLEALPGIGPVLAARIVEHREQHGAFASVEDLQRVRGVGPSLLGDLRELVTT